MIGGSLFSSSGSSIPNDLQPLVPLQIASSKANITSNSAISNANAEYDKLVDPNTPVPTPPVHAARLSALLKTLANAEGAVAESIKAREALIAALEKILDTNRIVLAREKTQASEITDRKNTTEAKKREVEDGIMRGLSAEESASTYGNGNSIPHEDPERPDVEALTPPPVESLTPTGSPKQDPIVSPTEIPQQSLPPAQSYAPPPSVSPPASIAAPLSILSSLTVPPVPLQNRPSQSPINSNGNATGPSSAKKRKMNPEDAFDASFGFTGEDAMADLDADVAELLRQESGGRL
jgi:regulator of Ty1 transposition protein 103